MLISNEINIGFITKCIACVFANKGQRNKTKVKSICTPQTQPLFSNNGVLNWRKQLIL